MNNSALIFLIILLIWLCRNNRRREGFYDLTSLGCTCGDCYYKKPRECLSCGNCGICIRGPYATCVPGDVEGPFFREQCEKWMYKDQKHGKVASEDKIIKSRPWNWMNPALRQTRWVSPVFRATLGN